MATFSDIDAWFPNSGSATPANLRTALKDATGGATAVQNFHAAADGDAALTTLGATVTGLAVLKAASAAAARTAIGAAGFSAPTTQTGDYAATTADIGRVVVFNVTANRVFTLPSLTGWATNAWLYVKSAPASTGLVTITPAGADTVDGGASALLYPNEGCFIVPDGATGWLTAGLPNGLRTIRTITIAGSPSQIDIALPAGPREFTMELFNVGPSVTAGVIARFTNNNFSTVFSGGSDYRFSFVRNTASATAGGAGLGSSMGLGAGDVGSSLLDNIVADIRIAPGSGASYPRLIIRTQKWNPTSSIQETEQSASTLVASASRMNGIRLATTAGVFQNGGVIRLAGIA